MKKYLIALIVLVLVLVAGYFYWQQNKSVITDPGQVACTMEAKICPDGVTYVGRQGPKCEFEKCPVLEPANTGMPSIFSISPSSGPVGTVITLKGSNLASAGNETYLGISESGQKSWDPDSISATEIKFTVPADLPLGSHSIDVFISAKQTPTSNPLIFTVTDK